MGPQNRDEVIRVLREAHLFFLPSNAEVLPVALMEAQATGLPVIATSVGGVSELTIDGQTGFLVSTRDVESMAGRLEYLITHPSSWPKMGLEGRKVIEEQFNIKKLNQRLVEIYQELLWFEC